MKDGFDFDKLLDEILEDSKEKSVREDDVDNILNEVLKKETKDFTAEKKPSEEKTEIIKTSAVEKEKINENFDRQFEDQQKKLINDIGRLLEEKKNSSHKDIIEEINKTVEKSNMTSEQKSIILEKTSGFKKFDIEEFNMIFGNPDENVYAGKQKKKKKRKKENKADYFETSENYTDLLFASDMTEEINKVSNESFKEDNKTEKTEEISEVKESLKDSNDESLLKMFMEKEDEISEEKETKSDFTKVIENDKKIEKKELFSKEDAIGDSTVVRMNSLKNAVEEVKEKKGFFKNIISSEEDDVDETLARDLGYFQSRKIIDEFEGPEDKESVEKSLEFQVKEAAIKIITCIIISIPLLILTLFPAMKINLPEFINPYENMFVYSIAVSVLTGILILCCFNTVIHGISSIFRLKPDQESLVAMALITSFVHSFYITFTNPQFEKIPFFYGGIAGVILTVNIIGKYLEAKVVLKNFGLVSSNHSKSAVVLYDEDNFSGNFPFKYKENEEKACIGVNAKFISDFLARSYSLENIERKIKPIHYFSFFVPIIVCIVKMILDKSDLYQLFINLSLGFCICAPLASTLSYWLPVSKITKILRKRGATLIGYGSIKKYKYIGAVTLSDKDLFRTKDITISALKFFEPTKIDEYITKIASLLNKTNSEVSNVFMKILENNKNILMEVQDYSFDKGQGIMGYIEGERILCGTRAYVSSYGVNVPSDLREDNLPVSKKVSYVSIGGKLVASFETNYKVTRSTFEMFREICKERLDIILYTMDYNLTEDLIRELFVIDGSLVCVIDKTFIPDFEAMTKPADRVKADIVSITGNKGIAFAVCKIPKISTVMSAGVLIKALTLVISLLIFLAVVFANGVTAATPVHILMFQLVWLIPYLFIYMFSK